MKSHSKKSESGSGLGLVGKIRFHVGFRCSHLFRNQIVVNLEMVHRGRKSDLGLKCEQGHSRWSDPIRRRCLHHCSQISLFLLFRLNPEVFKLKPHQQHFQICVFKWEGMTPNSSQISKLYSTQRGHDMMLVAKFASLRPRVMQNESQALFCLNNSSLSLPNAHSPPRSLVCSIIFFKPFDLRRDQVVAPLLTGVQTGIVWNWK